MVGHTRTTTSVGHCLQKMLLCAVKGYRFWLMIKIFPSSQPTMYKMGSIAVVLASEKQSI